jgi:hypothetical protein
MKTSAVVVAMLLLSTLVPRGPAPAAPIFDGDVTPQVYLPNSVNGWWKIDRAEETGVEVGLRAKIRWPEPLNVFNSNGDGTYSHSTGAHPVPDPVYPNRALWNYEFAANVDYTGTSGFKLYDGFADPMPNDVQVLLDVDTDPSAAVEFHDFEVMTWFANNRPAGHMTIVQNASNIAVLPTPPWHYDLNEPGIYDFRLTARRLQAPVQEYLARTTMQVIVAPPSPSLLGDYNQDGAVDAADYVVWRKNDGTNPQGYDDWRANFGRTLEMGPAAFAASSPEPGSLLLLVIGLALAFLLFYRRPRKAGFFMYTNKKELVRLWLCWRHFSTSFC